MVLKWGRACFQYECTIVLISNIKNFIPLSLSENIMHKIIFNTWHCCSLAQELTVFLWEGTQLFHYEQDIFWLFFSKRDDGFLLLNLQLDDIVKRGVHL